MLFSCQNRVIYCTPPVKMKEVILYPQEKIRSCRGGLIVIPVNR